MKAIETKMLSKSYGDICAVSELCLEVSEGELFALLGVNGAGKTTTIKMLSGLTEPTSGSFSVFGHSRIEDIKPLINVSPQETAVAPNLTVRENLEFVCGIYGVARADAKKRAEAMLKEMSMEEIANRRAKTLSGGWQRRLSIAMALISEPKLLFLDEPTLGLDVIARRELWKLIGTLKGKVTIVLTTHYLEEAEALSDRLAIMNGGRLAAVGTASELMAKTGCDKFEDAFVALCGGGDEL